MGWFFFNKQTKLSNFVTYLIICSKNKPHLFNTSTWAYHSKKYTGNGDSSIFVSQTVKEHKKKAPYNDPDHNV